MSFISLRSSSLILIYGLFLSLFFSLSASAQLALPSSLSTYNSVNSETTPYLYGSQDLYLGGVAVNDSDHDDPNQRLTNWGLNLGTSALNKWIGQSILHLSDKGQARINFNVDDKGHIGGEGDILLPLYDNAYTTVFTQIGLRSINSSDKDRWIGNFGLGQRWFPYATGTDPKAQDYNSGDLMLGYNLFFDYDFTRSHQRAGTGLEMQYDWLKLSTNYYLPLSSWKTSPDFDNAFMEERPAEGWDIHVKGYVPSYRQVAFTGSFTQWFGNDVGVFNANHLSKDPKVWSYGLEYTPVPALTTSIAQRHSEDGQQQTEFKVGMTYRFGVPFDEQFNVSHVNAMRTVQGSRHDFIDRENNIILEYRDKAFKVFLGESNYEIAGGGMLVLPFNARSRANLISVEWQGSAASYLISSDMTAGRFQMPAYVAGGDNLYTARVTLTNQKGQTAISDTATIKVLPTQSGYKLDFNVDNQNPIKGEKVNLTTHLSNNGVAVSGEEIVWSISPTGTISGDQFTNAMGEGKAILDTLLLAGGNYQVAVSLKGYPALKKTMTIKVAPASSGNYALTLETSPPNPSAGEIVTVKAKLTQNGQPVGNLPIELQLVSGDGTIITGQATADSNGYAELKWQAGINDSTLHIKAGQGSNILVEKDITIQLNHAYSLTLTSTPAVIKPGDDINIKAVLKNGNLPVPNIQLKLNIENGDGTLSLASVTTDAHGEGTLKYLASSTDSAVSLIVTASLPTPKSETIHFNVQSSYKIAISQQPIVAVAGQLLTFDAVLTNNNLPIANATLTLDIVEGGGSLQTSIATTDGTGKATLSWLAGTAKQAKLIIKAGTTVIYSQIIEINVTMDYALSINPATITLRAGEAVTLTSKITNGGLPVANGTLLWNVSPQENGNFSNATKTNANGESSVTFQSTKSGTITITLTYQDDPVATISKTINIDNNYRLVFNVDNPIIDNGATLPLHATIYDGPTPISGQVINWLITEKNGDGTLNASSSISNSNGIADNGLTASKGGNITVQASLASTPTIKKEQIITVAPSLNAVLSADLTALNTGDTTTLHLEVKDLSTPIANQSVNWEIVNGSTGLATLDRTTSQTESNGIASVALTATKGGIITLRASIPGFPSLTKDITLTIAPKYKLLLTSQSSTVGPNGELELSAVLKDGNSLISGKAIKWEATAGTVTATQSTTDQNGVATTKFKSQTAGHVTVTASLVEDVTIHQQLNLEVTEGFNLTLSSSTSSPQNGVPIVLSALLTNGSGSNAGEVLVWTVLSGSTGNGSFINAETTTGSTGQTQNTFQLNKSGNVILHVSLKNNPAIFADITVVIQPNYTLSFSSAATVLQNSQSGLYEVALKDGTQPVSGQTIYWSVDPASANSGLSSTTTQTNASGTSFVNFTPFLSGQARITATLDGTSVFATTPPITVSPNYQLSLSSNVKQVKNGDSFSLTAFLLDGRQGKNGAKINWQIISGGDSATLDVNQSQTQSDGIALAKITTRKAGDIVLQATLDDDPSIINTITLKVTPDYKLNLNAPSTSISNNQNAVLTATLFDGATPVDNTTINWTISNNSTGKATLDNTASVTGSDGKTTTTFNAQKSGTVTVTASLINDTTHADFTFVIVPVYSIELNTDTITLDNGASTTITARLKDGDSPVANSYIDWSIETTAAKGNGVINRSNSMTNNDGLATALFTATKGGIVKIRATLASSNVVTIEKTLTITPRYNLTLKPNPATIAAGETSNIRVHVTDGNTNLAGKAIRWSSNNGTFSSALTTTADDGRANTIFTPTSIGNLKIRATFDDDASVYQEISITVGAVYRIQLQSSADTIKTGGTAALTATVQDGTGASINTKLNWIIRNDSGGKGALQSAQTTTNGIGKTDNTLTASATGDIIVRVELASDPSVYAIYGIFVNPDYQLSFNAITPSGKTGEPITASVTLRDGTQRLPGQNIIWSIQGGNISDLDRLQSQTGNDGTASVIYTPSSGKDRVIIRGTVTNDTSVYAESSAIKISPDYKFTLTSNANNINTWQAFTLTANLQDGLSNVTGQQINWSVVSGIGEGSFSNASTYTDAMGNSSTQFITKRAGSITLRANVAGHPELEQDITLEIVPQYRVELIKPALLEIRLLASTALEVVVYDGDQRVDNVQINWNVSGIGLGLGFFSPKTSLTNEFGYTKSNIHATGIGFIWARATVNGYPAATDKIRFTILSLL